MAFMVLMTPPPLFTTSELTNLKYSVNPLTQHLSQPNYYWALLWIWKSGFVTITQQVDELKYLVCVCQGCCTFWSMKNSMCSRYPVPTPAPSSLCHGWSSEEKCLSAVPRLATLPLSPFTPNLSMEEKCTGESVAQGVETFQCPWF